MSGIGTVIIGRNEGERLVRCLASVPPDGPVVYVDSGSTDGSVAAARASGADVVELDMSVPFTAARGRNAGFARLMELAPGVAYVQFVDGDCELHAGWLESARAALGAQADVVAVAGRLRERHPEASIYNRLCDLEWAQPAGEAEWVGGIFMIRADAMRQAGGFDESVVAGEEPELCMRLRRRGWRIVRLGAEMALHDAAMTRFGQWWRRAVRGGYGSLDVARRFEHDGHGVFSPGLRSVRLWSIGWPLGVAAMTAGGAILGGPSTALTFLAAGLLLLPAQIARLGLKALRQGWPPAVALPHGALTMLGKFAQMQGQVQWWCSHRRGDRGPAPSDGACPRKGAHGA